MTEYQKYITDRLRDGACCGDYVEFEIVVVKEYESGVVDGTEED